jgi:dTDP-4-dehydrorhamnose 3,5-epimerase
MRFEPTEIPGVLIVEAEPKFDERGFFCRLYCADEFANAGIDFTPVQINLSRNLAKGVLRGLHWRKPPMSEAKLVRVVRGRLFDVVVDARPGSPAFRRWTGVELDARSTRAVYVPEGCGHGFLTLKPDTDVQYLMSRPYQPGFDGGARWDDPAFGVVWPEKPEAISARDEAWPPFDEAAHPFSGI